MDNFHVKSVSALSVTTQPEKIDKYLRAYGITPTKQRVDIARILFERPQHMSAEQVLNVVNAAEQHTVSKATVYNTLGLFASKGLIKEVIVDPSKVFYDSNVSPHYHFYNVDTGKLIDIPVDEVMLSNMPQLPEGTEAAGIDVIVRVKQR